MSDARHPHRLGHGLGGGLEPVSAVGLEAALRIDDRAGECVRDCLAVLDGLTGALTEVGQHGMPGITEQRDPAERQASAAGRSKRSLRRMLSSAVALMTRGMGACQSSKRSSRPCLLDARERSAPFRA